MYSNDPIVYRKERRRKPDLICLWLQVSSFLVWAVLLVILLFFNDARPQLETFWDRLLSVQVRGTWDFSNINLIFYLLVFLFLLSAVSVLLNLKRLKRSTDRIRVSFIISFVGSFVGIIMYLFFYVQ